MMRAMILQELGMPLRLRALPVPEPGDGEVLLRVAAAGVNFADLLIMEGRYQERPALPFSPGMEVCGTVEAVGPGVSTPAVGTRVAAFSSHGGMAELACFPAGQCIAVPDGMSSAEAAGFLVAYGTSHLGLVRRARLKSGESLLVLGAAGGIGRTAVEVGAILGARVIACASSEAKLKVASEAGAHELVNTSTDDIRAATLRLGGADVVFDPVGGDQFKAAMRASNPEARLMPVGFASGEAPQIPANILLVKNLTVVGFYWGGYMRFNRAAIADSARALLELHGRRRLRPHICRQLRLEEANAAFELLRSRTATGKVIVAVGES